MRKDIKDRQTVVSDTIDWQGSRPALGQNLLPMHSNVLRSSARENSASGDALCQGVSILAHSGAYDQQGKRPPANEMPVQLN